ncbi:MAG TPA: hypothetical protein P5057_02960, partial [Acidobacteriota bacterium]|nr:hypothetical protein [Acidobacteriota bacterium]
PRTKMPCLQVQAVLPGLFMELLRPPNREVSVDHFITDLKLRRDPLRSTSQTSYQAPAPSRQSASYSSLPSFTSVPYH